jgi:hypothetical protein
MWVKPASASLMASAYCQASRAIELNCARTFWLVDEVECFFHSWSRLLCGRHSVAKY